MRVLKILAPEAVALAIEVIQEEPIVVQLPSVFVLLSAPTQQGTSQLDRIKKRLPGKNYGTAVGSLDQLLAQADPSYLPSEFSRTVDFEKMTGSFIRLRFRDEHFNSPVIRHGTHQAVLLNGAHRNLFKRIEESFLARAPDNIWGGGHYTAPLCTSFNASGDPAGSITDMDRALRFGRDQGLGLLLSCDDRATELGSYPILGYQSDSVTIHREGPYIDQFKMQISERLRTW